MKRATRTREGYHWFRGWRKPSAAQRRVLDELVQGRTNAEIATRLGISEDGVKWHLSELRQELEIDDRHQLAEWWRGQRSRSAILLPIGVLGRLLGNHAAIAVAAVTVLAVAIGWLAYASLDGTDDGAATRLLAAQTAAAAPVVIAPTPTPTPTPVPPTALVFDVQARTATSLPGTITYRRWLDTEAMTFVGYGNSSLVTINAEGHIQPISEGSNVNGYYPIADRAQVVLWRSNQNSVNLLDVETMTEQRLIDLISVLPGGSPADIATRSRRVALLDATAAELSIVNFDGGGRRLLFTAPTDEGITDAHWSPDGSRLLVHLGRRQANGRASTRDRFVVLDATGRALIGRQGTAGWAGYRTVLHYTGDHGQTPAGTLDVIDGTESQAIDPDSLLCVSPDGKHGVYRYPAAVVSRTYRYELRDLAAASPIIQVESGEGFVNCDWTPDSRKAVLSPGGK